MMKLSRLVVFLLITSLANLFAVIPAKALIPPLPSSFYGTVKVNGENVADGTVVRALINGQVYSTGYTQTYQGDSVYSLDVPGDDSSTTEIEGGKEGDIVQFDIAGVLAVETGTWKSATNTSVNLTASSAAPLNTPQATPTPVPTQTPIKLPTKLPTATRSAASSSTETVSEPTSTAETFPTLTPAGEQVLPQPTKSVGQPPDGFTAVPKLSPTSIPAQIPEENKSGNNILWIVFILIVMVILVWTFRIIRKSNSKQAR